MTTDEYIRFTDENGGRQYGDAAHDVVSGHWVCCRLAVGKAAYHTGKVGTRLEAVRQVQRQGATQFTARIQAQNVRFFQRLGWKPLDRQKTTRGGCIRKCRLI